MAHNTDDECFFHEKGEKMRGESLTRDGGHVARMKRGISNEEI